MRGNGKGFSKRALMLALAAFLALPGAALAQGRGHGRHKDDVFVNGHDARDGRYDGRGPRRDRDDDQWRRDRRRDDDRYDRRDRDGDGDYDRNDEYIRRRQEQQRRNGGYDGYGSYGRYGNRGYGNYGYGNYTQSQQTALNAGYNDGIKEGRKDRSRGTYHDLEDFSAYRNATHDYNSRIGDRYEYQQYYRRGFENGYRTGLNGY